MTPKSDTVALQRGDIVILTFSNIGVATSPPDAAGYVPTVEGNTNSAGQRDGIEVMAKRQKFAEIRSRIRV